MIDVIFSPIALALGSILIMGGGAYYYFVMSKNSGSGTKKFVVIIKPGDHRGLEIPVVKETAKWIYCKTVDEIPRKFYKVAPSYVFPTATKWFCVEGIGYTHDVTLPDQLQQETVTIDKALRVLWGDEKYEKMPNKSRGLIENSRWGFTIAIDAVEDSTMPIISSEALREKDDESVLHILAEDARNQEKKGKFDFQQMLIGGAVGAFLVYILINQGYLRVAG